MPVFFERYVLPLLAGILITVVIANVWELTWPARAGVAAASLICAFGVSHSVYRHSQGKAPAVAPTSASVSPSPRSTSAATGSAAPLPVAAVPVGHRAASKIVPFSPFSTLTPVSTVKRIYININAKYLINIFQTVTYLNANKIIADYKGKWTRVYLPIDDIDYVLGDKFGLFITHLNIAHKRM
jgi:hypothetical protein